MNWKKNPATDWKIYCIVDKKVLKGADPVRIAKGLLRKGAKAIQLRFKNYPSYEIVKIAKRIKKYPKAHHASIIINDRVDAALASGSTGVHLGSGDLSAKTARFFLGPGSVIGKTVHSVKDAKKTESIDYVGAGPVFKTPLKKNLKMQGTGFVKRIKKEVSVPVLAIGGINSKNAKTVMKNGADGVCITRATKELKRLKRQLLK